MFDDRLVTWLTRPCSTGRQSSENFFTHGILRQVLASQMANISDKLGIIGKMWFYPSKGIYYIFKQFYLNLLNNDFHNFISSKRYIFFWIGNRCNWRMNLVVNLWTASGTRIYSKVFYDFLANSSLVSKPILVYLW